jgi:hypothetical protein
MNIRVHVLCLLLLSMWTSCRFGTETKEAKMERLCIYTAEDEWDESGTFSRLIAVEDMHFDIPAELSLREKVQHLADTLSVHYFNGLEIQLLALDTLNESGNILTINLVEHPNYQGPGSLSPYKSWYDYFQGSAGGGNTTIVLKESFLQRDYEGQWIDGIIFYYQGKEMQDLDHVNLHGLLLR